MKIQIGDIFWFEVTYPKTGETESRPVVVIEMEYGNPVIAVFSAITGSAIKDFDGKYDKWKVPLFRWQQSGLQKASFVKANCIAQTETSALTKQNFIGKMAPSGMELPTQ